jgi:LmbE family N-acetylglucosaminyl deacetylase
MKTSLCIEAFDWSLYERVIVLSPHLDDAVLSAFGLLSALRERASRLVVTIACGNPTTPEGKASRVRRGHVPPVDRRREDREAMRALDCHYLHLGFEDCVFRRSPITGELIYRTPRNKFTIAAPDDRAYVEELYLVLRRICYPSRHALLVAPLGIGYHVDHLICAQVALRIAPLSQILFYEDVPYVFSPEAGKGDADGPLSALERLGCAPSQRLAVPFVPEEKVQLAELYTSQIPGLFPGEGTLARTIAERTYLGRPSEFFWKATHLKEEEDE